jgi:hypothetical protein
MTKINDKKRDVFFGVLSIRNNHSGHLSIITRTHPHFTKVASFFTHITQITHVYLNVKKRRN